MAKIIYFGTEGNGRAGHYPMGIDQDLTHEECKIWTECDNETWINNICENPGRHLIKHYGVVYTNYAVPFSVDDERNGSHADHMKADLKMLLQCDAYVRSRQRRLLH